MSHDDLPDSVAIISSRLRDLLEKARSLKSSTDIEPALSTTDFAADVRNLAAASVTDTATEAEVESVKSINQNALEAAAREILYEKIGAVAVQEPDFVDVWNLLDILQICGDQRQFDAGLALWLVEEMLDSQTIEGCRYILEYLKSRRTQVIGKELTRNKSNTILRTCNELLKRLSRAEDAVFCGDVFVFLFQVFPLGDKSAVNLRGEFHVENTTTFDPDPDVTEGEQDAQATNAELMQVDQDQPPGQQAAEEQPTREPQVSADTAQGKAQDSTTPSISINDSSRDGKKDETSKEEIPDSRALYPTFWSLQHIFSNPTRSFDTEALAGFKKGLELTFAKFKAAPKVPRVAGQSRKRKRNGTDHDFASTFNPKYLTSRDLFDLELSDLTFQRHILVQALILLDFLLSLTPEAKKKTEILKAQKSMVYNFTLNEEDTKWCRDLKRTISQYLQEGPDGRFYHRMVDNVLSRDRNWVVWKIESCQDISRPPVSFSEYIKSVEGIKRSCAPRRVKSHVMGSLNLEFLDESNSEYGLDKLRDPARLRRPDTEAIVSEVRTIDLDLEMIDKETQPEEWAELITRRASKTWRALRLERMKHLSKFAKIDESKNFEDLIKPEEPPPVEPEPEVQSAEQNGDEAGNVNGIQDDNHISAEVGAEAVSEAAPNDGSKDKLREEGVTEPDKMNTDEAANLEPGDAEDTVSSA